jgi:hypothetical protein
VVVAPTREELEQVKLTISHWLTERGLEFNEEKTRIVHIDTGFDFLGFHVRRYADGKVLVTPQKRKGADPPAQDQALAKYQQADPAGPGHQTPESYSVGLGGLLPTPEQLLHLPLRRMAGVPHGLVMGHAAAPEQG